MARALRGIPVDERGAPDRGPINLFSSDCEQRTWRNASSMPPSKIFTEMRIGLALATARWRGWRSAFNARAAFLTRYPSHDGHSSPDATHNFAACRYALVGFTPLPPVLPITPNMVTVAACPSQAFGWVVNAAARRDGRGCVLPVNGRPQVRGAQPALVCESNGQVRCDAIGPANVRSGSGAPGRSLQQQSFIRTPLLVGPHEP